MSAYNFNILFLRLKVVKFGSGICQVVLESGCVCIIQNIMFKNTKTRTLFHQTDTSL